MLSAQKNEMLYRPFRRLQKGARVLVAFSGGVDSAVAAALCLEAGLRPLGLNMRLLEEENAETEKASLEKVKNAADALGIELEFLDLKAEFQEKIMRACWDEYAAGRTPNPCVLCNPFFKFGKLAELALTRGCEGLVTGHYVRIEEEAPSSSAEEEGGRCLLRRGVQREKDQSYFLYALSGEQLAFSHTPLGDRTKDEVRKIAEKLGLPNAGARESQDACFTPEKVAAIHKTVGTILDIAYAMGGAALVEQKIDKLATDGKITPQQGEMLKEAARKSYADLQKRLKELSVADIEVSAEK